MRSFLVVALSALAAGPAAAAHLRGSGAFVLDLAGAQRPRFSSTEQLTLVQKVINDGESGARINFTFRIRNPSGTQVFQHAGNSAPATTTGEASTQVSGIPISRFYTVPGVYTLEAVAELDGETVTQPVTFEVTSPLITLLYPPDGARGLADRPLTLHWTGSGSSRYRVLVDDDASFYNTLFTGQTVGAENTFTYPANPSDQRQRLAAGQVYYWKVEGLDAFGNLVAASGTPYSFSLQGAEGTLVRDVAVTALDPSGAPEANGAIPFRVVVRNQGGTTENSVQMRFTVGGIAPPNTPVRIQGLGPGEERTLTVPARAPMDQTESLVVACVDLFDDSVMNNCQTLLMRRPAPAPLAPGTTEQAPALLAGTTSQASSEQQIAAAWDSLRASAPPEVAKQLEGMVPAGISGDGMTAAQAAFLLQAVRDGKAKVLKMEIE